MAISAKYGHKITPNGHCECPLGVDFLNGYFSPIVIECLFYNGQLCLILKGNIFSHWGKRNQGILRHFFVKILKIDLIRFRSVFIYMADSTTLGKFSDKSRLIPAFSETFEEESQTLFLFITGEQQKSTVVPNWLYLLFHIKDKDTSTSHFSIFNLASTSTFPQSRIEEMIYWSYERFYD